MADEIRNGDSKTRVVRLLGHRDDTSACEIRDFLKRSVVGGSSSRPKKTVAASQASPTERVYSVLHCGMLPTDSALSSH